MKERLRTAIAHAEKLGLAFDPSVAYWRGYYAGDTNGEPAVGTERLRVFREALTSVSARGLWLEAGCGIGVMARQFRDSGLRVCGIDASAALLDEARRVTGLALVAVGEAPPPGEHLCRASVERLPYTDEHFDGAYASSVLEYAASLELALSELHRVVRKGGHLVFNLPNAVSVFRIWHALVRRRAEYYRLVPRWAYWRRQIAEYLERSGWEPLRFGYYGAERNAPSLPLFVPSSLRERLADEPWAASYVLIIARRR